MTLTGSNIIAGQPSREGSATFTSVNPRTRQAGTIQFVAATPGEINNAATQATAAFDITRNYPATKLADFLDIMADEIEAMRPELIETTDMETGLGETRLSGELTRTTNQLKAFGDVLREGSYVDAIIDTAIPDRQPAPRADIRRMLFPIGPVVNFGASNFPYAFAIPGGDTAAAFAAGCPVIAKAHPGHPATSELFAQAINRAIEKAGFPTGFFSMLHGDSPEVGQALVKHPLVKAVAFTGSVRAGRAIFDTAAARQEPIPVYAEMGSVNPVVILPDAIEARAEAIADGLVTSATLGAGQFCTNPGLILMIEDEHTQAFITSYTGKMGQRAPGVLLNARIEEGLAQTVRETLNHQVEILTGGEPVSGTAYCYTNTVLQTNAATFLHDPWLQTEHFGPVTLFVLCQSMDELRECIGVLHGSLTATIHAEDSDLETVSELYNLLREKAGRLIWNGYPTGVEVVYAMHHGGPYPATTAPATTSVGFTAITRFMRPIAFQNIPPALLPPALQDNNPLGIMRIVNGERTREPIGGK